MCGVQSCNSWQVASGLPSRKASPVTFVSYIALIISLLALPVASSRLTLPRLAFLFGLLIIHLAATILSYNYAQSHIADSALYYYDLWHFANKPWWSLGTVFVIHIAQALKGYLGASYLDCFMMFQAIGFWGIMILMRTFEELHEKILAPQSTVSKYLLFLPSIHFWTASIGKDAILFFAMALCTWSILNVSRRIMRLGFALLLMVLVRAHIAVLVVASLAIAATLYRGLSLGRRVTLLLPALLALAVLGAVVQSSIGIDLSDPGSVATFLEERTDVIAGAAGNTSLNGQPFTVRLVSLLFRPMFVDARNALGLVASMENVFFVLIYAYCLIRWREVVELYKKVYFIRFALVLTLGLMVLLAIVNYNVGLGLRQRTMFLPLLLSIFVAIWAFRQRLKDMHAPRQAGAPGHPLIARSAVAGTLTRAPPA